MISLKEGYRPTEKNFVAVEKKQIEIIEMSPQKEPPSNEKEVSSTCL